MNYKDYIDKFLVNNDITLNMYKDKIYIGNYNKINHFDFNEVVVSGNEKKIVILGSNLVISKLLKDEILITGNFSRIDIK